MTEISIESTLGSLSRRGFKAFHFPTAEEAVQHIVASIPSGAVIGLGGSKTVQETGLLDTLRQGDYDILDRFAPGVTKEEVDAMRIKGLSADVFLCSANAITEDGQVVNIDGMGNRVAAISYGPDRVIMIAGTNKLTKEIHSALDRTRNTAAALNARRLSIPSPCAEGPCDIDNCEQPNRICNIVTVLEGGRGGRIEIVLIDGSFGF